MILQTVLRVMGKIRTRKNTPTAEFNIFLFNFFFDGNLPVHFTDHPRPVGQPPRHSRNAKKRTKSIGIAFHSLPKNKIRVTL